MKTRLAALTLVALLALTGCSAAGADSSNEDVQRGSSTAATETPEPLVAETPDADEPGEDVTTEADQEFLEYVQSELPPATSIGDASDAQLIVAGHEACAQAEAGVAWEDIRLVEGEQPSSGGYYLDSSAILNGALYNYCPDLIPAID